MLYELNYSFNEVAIERKKHRRPAILSSMIPVKPLNIDFNRKVSSPEKEVKVGKHRILIWEK